MSTISDLLEKTLIDIQNNDGNNDNNNNNDNKPSAVSLLLLERKKQREISKGKHQEEDFIRIAPLSKIFAESNFVISGTKHGAGFTKFVELIPNKNDSVSTALYDSLFQGI